MICTIAGFIFHHIPWHWNDFHSSPLYIYITISYHYIYITISYLYIYIYIYSINPHDIPSGWSIGKNDLTVMSLEWCSCFFFCETIPKWLYDNSDPLTGQWIIVMQPDTVLVCHYGDIIWEFSGM
jgi:hypothetical protein